MRAPTSTDLVVDVEGIGRFIFAKRTMRDKFGIRGAYAALTQANYDEKGGTADIGALAYVTIESQLVAGPRGFSLEEMDPDTGEEALVQVFLALREQEGHFRGSNAQAVQGGRATAGAELRDVVPPAVQPATD